MNLETLLCTAKATFLSFDSIFPQDWQRSNLPEYDQSQVDEEVQSEAEGMARRLHERRDSIKQFIHESRHKLRKSKNKSKSGDRSKSSTRLSSFDTDRINFNASMNSLSLKLDALIREKIQDESRSKVSIPSSGPTNRRAGADRIQRPPNCQRREKEAEEARNKEQLTSGDTNMEFDCPSGSNDSPAFQHGIH